MNIEEFLKQGYFPKELPPIFNSNSFAHNYDSINKSWIKKFNSLSKTDKKLYNESLCVKFSIPKTGLARKEISIPNPLHQSKLSEILIKNYSFLESIYKKSKISSSRPIIDTTKNRAYITVDSYNQFIDKCIMDSLGFKYELSLDISRFFPTLYTHVIPWAIHTKKIAKQKRNDKSLLGNQIDDHTRFTQSNQTMGIPIGPDSSLLISEIIGCTIDYILQYKYKNISGHRYIDDYKFYFKTLSEAENFCDYLRETLRSYELDINEEKTGIELLPKPFTPEWVIMLSSFKFRETKQKQETDIKNFFSLAIDYSIKYPKDSVLKYAIKCLESHTFNNSNFSLLESCIFHCLMSDTDVIQELYYFLNTSRDLISKRKLQNIMNDYIEYHFLKGHSYEISWALFIAIDFKIKIRKSIAEKILRSEDVISIIMCLDMRKNGLVSKSIDISFIEKEFHEDLLFHDKWLLYYEACVNKWFKPSISSKLDNNHYFKILKDHNVTFYTSPLKSRLLKKKLQALIQARLKSISKSSRVSWTGY